MSLKGVLGLDYLKRMFWNRSGNTFKIAICLSLIIIVVTGCTSTVPALNTVDFFDGIPPKTLFLPLIISAVGMIIFFLFNLVDLCTGLLASRIEFIKLKEECNPIVDKRNNFVQPDLLFKSIFKFTGVGLVVLLINAFIMMFMVLQYQWVYDLFTWLLLSILLCASLYEFESIGNNIQRAFGSTPKIFTFVNTLTVWCQNKFMEKLNQKCK